MEHLVTCERCLAPWLSLFSRLFAVPANQVSGPAVSVFASFGFFHFCFFDMCSSFLPNGRQQFYILSGVAVRGCVCVRALYSKCSCCGKRVKEIELHHLRFFFLLPLLLLLLLVEDSRRQIRFANPADNNAYFPLSTVGPLWRMRDTRRLHLSVRSWLWCIVSGTEPLAKGFGAKKNRRRTEAHNEFPQGVQQLFLLPPKVRLNRGL